MISVLVVGGEREDIEEVEATRPSVELLAARGVEDALEKLGRNRRIDAVLLLSDDALAVVAAIEEDNPAHPPLFLPAGRQAAPGTRILAGTEPGELIGLLIGELRS